MYRVVLSDFFQCIKNRYWISWMFISLTPDMEGKKTETYVMSLSPDVKYVNTERPEGSDAAKDKYSR